MIVPDLYNSNLDYSRIYGKKQCFPIKIAVKSDFILSSCRFSEVAKTVFFQIRFYSSPIELGYTYTSYPSEYHEKVSLLVDMWSLCTGKQASPA